MHLSADMTLRLLSFSVLFLSFACAPGGSTDDGDGGSADSGEFVSDGGSDANAAEDGCRSASECGPYETGAPECAQPDPTSFPRAPCGACLQDEDQCASDEDCGAGFACRPEGPCGCGEATLVCVEGCQSNADCLTGQICDADSHCVATACTAAADCPSQFTCSTGACERLTCSDDADCDAGYCVGGSCFDELGSCFENIPVP